MLSKASYASAIDIVLFTIFVSNSIAASTIACAISYVLSDIPSRSSNFSLVDSMLSKSSANISILSPTISATSDNNSYSPLDKSVAVSSAVSSSLPNTLYLVLNCSIYCFPNDSSSLPDTFEVILLTVDIAVLAICLTLSTVFLTDEIVFFTLLITSFACPNNPPAFSLMPDDTGLFLAKSDTLPAMPPAALLTAPLIAPACWLTALPILLTALVACETANCAWAAAFLTCPMASLAAFIPSCNAPVASSFILLTLSFKSPIFFLMSSAIFTGKLCLTLEAS